jgi:hypothetical protein
MVGINLYLANGDLTLFLSLMFIFVFVGLYKLDYAILLFSILVGVFNLVYLSGVVFILELLLLILLLFDNFLYFIFQLSAD